MEKYLDTIGHELRKKAEKQVNMDFIKETYDFYSTCIEEFVKKLAV